MKLLDILGTSSDTFSLGLGENKIEFRSIEGVLYFRNFGTGWQRASSESLRESLRLRSWTSGITIAQDEIFLHSGAMWYSNITLNTSNFINDSKNFVKVKDLYNFNTFNVQVENESYLTTENSDFLYIRGVSTNTIFNIYLPNTQTLHRGRQIIISNETILDVHIYKNRPTISTPDFTVGPNETKGIIVIDNATIEGTWASFNFSGGGGGGGGSSEIEVILNLGDYGGTNPFKVNDIVSLDSNGRWQKTYSSNEQLDTIGFISFSSGQQIKVRFGGELTGLSLNGNPLVPGAYYYLTDNNSPTTIGSFTSSPGYINKKVFKAASTSKVYIVDRSERERFEERIDYSLADGAEVVLNDTNYTFKIDGYVNNDNKLITFNGIIVSGTPTEAVIETVSDYLSEVEISTNSLSFFIRGNDLIMKNNLGSTKNIIIYRKKTK